MSDSIFYTAQICLNGHIITDAIEININGKFLLTMCSKTIIKSPNCNTGIRGDYRPQGNFYSPENLIVVNYERTAFAIPVDPRSPGQNNVWRQP